MAQSVIVRGDLVEFLGSKRCEACQTRDRDCIMRLGADGCLLCSDSRSPCIFVRQVQVRGPASKFSQTDLLAERGPAEPINMEASATEEYAADEVPCQQTLSASSQRIPVARTTQCILSNASSNAIPTRDRVSAVSNRASNEPVFKDHNGLSKRQRSSYRSWNKALTVLLALSAFRAAGRQHGTSRLEETHPFSPFSFQTFDTQMNRAKRSGPLDEMQRKRVAATRKIGACNDCRRSHLKVCTCAYNYRKRKYTNHLLVQPCLDE